MHTNNSDYAAMLQFFENQAHQAALEDYESSISSHLVQLEMAVSASVCSCQPDFAGMRMCCVNSLFDVCNRLSWHSATFSLAVHMLDVYASHNAVDRTRYRLVAFCCLWIASKYNENKPKGKLVDALLRRAGYRLTQKKAFLALEARILNCIGWDLSYPATESFVDLLLNKAEPNNIERRYGALCLCELAHFNADVFHRYSASAIAASAILVTNVALLNLRHKHIYQHRFGALDTLLLKSVRFMPSAVRYKYVDCDARQLQASPHYSSKAAVIHNLVGLANCFVKEQRELDLQGYGKKLLQTCSSPVHDARRCSVLPISPIASPTRARSSPISPASPLSNERGPGAPNAGAMARRSSQGSACLLQRYSVAIPTPGSTPTTFSAAKNYSCTPQMAFTPAHVLPVPYLPVPYACQPPLLAAACPHTLRSVSVSSLSAKEDGESEGRCLKRRRL